MIQPKRSRNKYVWIVAGLVFVITWILLGLVHEPLAQWCEVTYPRRVAMNQAVPITVHYFDILKKTKLNVGLHWYRKDKSWQGTLSTAETQPIVSGSGEHSFVIRIEEREDLGYINIVLFLGKTGRWSDRIEAGRTEIIPVKRKVRYLKLKTRRPYNIPMQGRSASDGRGDETNGSEAGSSDTLRKQLSSKNIQKWIASFAYMIAALLCVLCAFRSKTAVLPHYNRHHFVLWSLFLGILIFLGIDHVFGISSSLTDLGRGISKLHGWYEERNLFQRSMISGLYSLIAALLIKTTSASGKKTLGLRLALLGTSFLITLYVVRSLSFHYIDVLLEHAINDVHVFYLAELLGISCVITAGVFCRIEKR